MRTKLLCALVAIAMTGLLPAVFAQRSEWWVKKRNNQVVEGERIAADEQGNLMVTLNARDNVTATIKRSDVADVHTPEPSVIRTLSSLYEQEAYDRILTDDLDKVFDRFKFLGWADEIGYIKGMSMLKQGKAEEAEKVFDEAMRYVYTFEDRGTLQRGLVEAYMAQGKYDDAKEIVSDMSTKDPTTAAYAYNLRGRLLENDGKKRDAVLQHLKVIMLFPDAGSITKSSYEHAIELLKSMKDRRHVELQKEMQEKYQ